MVFSYLENNNDVTSIGKLVFTIDNYKNYKEELIEKINKIIKNDVNNCIINNKGLSKIALEIISHYHKIQNVLFNFNEQLDYEIYESINSDDTLKYINCYNIEEYMFNELNKNNKKVDIRKKLEFNSLILQNNDIYTFSDIYYKKYLKIDNFDIYSDVKDLELFFKYNKFLEKIDTYRLTYNDIYKIIEILKNNNVNNLIINITVNDTTFKYIKKNLKKIKKLKQHVKKTNSIILNLDYSKLYKKRYLSSFVVNKYVQVAIFLFVMINLSIIGIFGYNSYKAFKEAESVKPNVIEVNNNVDETDIDDVENFSTFYTVENNEDRQVKNFPQLLAQNSETVGWIKVNNTKVDYSVVQHSDNNYYINKNFYQNNSPYGWIFMDYRNNAEYLDQNTILYGHNITIKDIMFGSLRKTLEKEWYTNKNNQIISFDTIYKSMNWQIFAIYTTDPDFNYLQNNYYYDGTQFLNFINEVKNRSIYDFGVEVNKDDKILTLSTCHQYGTKRLVIHAKLLQ